MARAQVHYEVFFRRTVRSDWRLENACENRAQALEMAEGALREGRAVSVRVTKEVFDEETREYQSYTILTKGEPEPSKSTSSPASGEALGAADIKRALTSCVGVADLYTTHAREKIARLLEDWLRRRNITAFELLHRPDLAESLDASGVELQHAIQKIAVAENQGAVTTLHDVIRAYQKLVEQAFARLAAVGVKGEVPDVAPQTFEAAARALADRPDRQFLLGCGLATALAKARDTTTKLDLLLDFAEGLALAPPIRALCRAVVEQPLAEILGARHGITGLLGAELDSGASLLALTRLTAPREVEALMRADAGLAALTPALTGPAARLAHLLATDDFALPRRALARRVLAELTGPRRLRPNDPDGEIAVLRALAMALTASAGRTLSLDEVQAAFLSRSASLISPDFVTALTQAQTGILGEAEALIRLMENVAGQMNRNRAAEWLSSCIGSPRFERECRKGGADSAMSRLSTLTSIDRSVRRAELRASDERQICMRLGELAGLIEADARLCQLLSRSPAPLVQRMGLLLRLAVGELCPPGPAATRASAELLRMVRAPEGRAALAASPDMAERVRELIAA